MPRHRHVCWRGILTRTPWRLSAFRHKSFDLVVTLDALEYLPSCQRIQMVDECLCVTKRGLVVIAPFAIPEAVAAENLLLEFIRCVLGAEHGHLREHLVNGLPDRAGLEVHLQELGYPYLVRPSGYIHRWLGMMLLKHYVMSLHGSESLHRQIDRYYNLCYCDADQRAPSYRSLVFIAKTDDTQILEEVSQALSGACADSRENGTAEVSHAERRELRVLGVLQKKCLV